MVKSYEKQAKSKADIAKENKAKNLERTSGGGGIHAGKSKDKIAKEKSLITKQKIKEKKKAPTQSEKKDLDAAHRRVTGGGGIHAGKSPKGKDIEIKQKPKVKIKSKSKKDTAQQKSKKALERKRAGIKISTPKKHPAHDPDKGGGIHKGKPPKGKYEKKSKGGAQAAEVKKKPLSPEQKKKDKAIMKAEEARRKKAKSKAKSEKAKKDSAPIMKAEKKRRAEGKKDIPTGRSYAASGYAKREATTGKKFKHVLGKVKDKPSGRK